MVINHNLAAMNATRNLGLNQANASKSLEKLSSGYRINRAGDDAAGLSISEKMRGQIRGLNQASRNSQDAISLIQTAEGALSETHSILQRMRELAVQSANDTNVTIDRGQIQKELNALTSEVNRIGNTTEFNTMKLLDGSKAKVSTASTISLNSGTKNISYAANLSSAGTANLGQAVVSVVVGAGEFATAAAAASASAYITLTVSNAGTINVTMNATAVGTFTASDTISANSDGSFTYNDHGVSFSIAASAVATLTNGSTITLQSISATGTYGTKSDYTLSNFSAGASLATMSNITVVAGNDNENARWLFVDVASQGASGIATVTITSDSAGANIIAADVYNYTTGTTDFTYNDHGFTFTLSAIGSLTSAATVTASISLSGIGTTTTDTAFNDQSLKFQVGANQNQAMTLDVDDMRGTGLKVSATTGGAATVTKVDGTTVSATYVSAKNVSNGTDATNAEFSLDVSTHDTAAAAVTVYDNAINKVSDQRAKLGATQNRLEHTIANLDTAAENFQASESRIRDVDMAKEMMEFSKNNILMQAAQSMLAQANQQPQGVLQLLR